MAVRRAYTVLENEDFSAVVHAERVTLGCNGQRIDIPREELRLVIELLADAETEPLGSPYGD